VLKLLTVFIAPGVNFPSSDVNKFLKDVAAYNFDVVLPTVFSTSLKALSIFVAKLFQPFNSIPLCYNYFLISAIVYSRLYPEVKAYFNYTVIISLAVAV
jgi:hypothetical protein